MSQPASGTTSNVTLLDQMADGYILVDDDWRFLYLNEQAERLVRRPRDELIGNRVWDAFPPLRGTPFEREYRRAVQDQVGVHFQALYEPYDQWFEVHAYPADRQLAIFLRNVDRQRRTAEALEARARQHRVLAELGLQALAGGDLPSLMDEAVRRVAEALGVTHVKVLELLPGGAELALRAGVGWKPGVVGQASVPTDRGSQAGYTLLHDGAVIVEDFAHETRFARPDLLAEHGIQSGMSVVIRGQLASTAYGILGAHSERPRKFTEDDTSFLQNVANLLALATTARTSRLALERSEQRFRELADHVDDVLFMTNADASQMLYINPAYEKIWARPCAEVYSRPDSWMDAIHPDDRPAVEAALPAMVRGEYDEEFRIVRPDGEIRWIHDRVFPVPGNRGGALRLVGIATDITEHKALAAEQAARAASEATAEARNEALATVSHDLRAPLHRIAIALESLEPPVDASPETAIIRHAVADMERLVQDLLDVARFEAGKVQLALEPLQPSSLLAEAREAHAPIAAERRIGLEVEVEPGTGDVHADRHLIQRVLANLLSNAFTHTEGGGRIVLGAQWSGAETVRFRVTDTGCGIDAEDLPHLFERFWQARHGVGTGAGLGLAIVKNIVESHGGRVTVDSVKGRGTTIYFELPAAGRGPRRG